jgi:hypothetical protein
MDKPKKGPVKNKKKTVKKETVKKETVKKETVKKETVKKETVKKPNPKPKKEKVKEKVRKGVGITVIQENKENYMDNSYPEKINLIIKKIKDQNTMIDDKIRFGWNN